MPQESKYFLPYQVRWLKDCARIKIWEKSRRIGATYVQSFEDVRDIVEKREYVKGRPIRKVYFTSADESAAREYIDYCAQWAGVFNVVVSLVGEVVMDEEKDIKALCIDFKNGGKIFALTSNPKRFRSKGGKAVWDEAAWHDDQAAMWKALRPTAMWGYPIRVLSTHHGKQSMFYGFVEDTKSGKTGWSLHTIPIQLAVAEGLLDKLMGRKTTEQERQEWLEQERRDCRSDDIWQEEYCCVPVDESSAFLTYEMIMACERPAAQIMQELETIQGEMYLGMDVGRRKDLSIIWVVEKSGMFKTTRIIKTLEKMPFDKQRQELFRILAHPKLRRACIDATGLGMQLAEEAQQQFGKYRVEAITITNKVKEEIAYVTRINFEDKSLHIPDDPKVREDLHSLKRVVTTAGNIRFDVEKSATDGHADRFIALGLALHAAASGSGQVAIVTGKRRETLRNYDRY
ncbi:MAG TPA: terminase family protein [bacterium]|nr:terminase family protein [bacterium]